MKSSGINSKLLTKDMYVQLLNGNDITTKSTNFRLSWKKLSLRLSLREIKSKGLYTSIKTVLNVTDTNFKFISFVKKHEIMIIPFL
jgi:hypothetical protein